MGFQCTRALKIYAEIQRGVAWVQA
jgi:hypothetical protein